MNQSTRYFDEDFKNRAVRMVLDGRGVNEVSKDLGIARSTLQRWRKSCLGKMDAVVAAGELSATDLADENARLRKELAYVSEQRDILKKRSASSARSEAERGDDEGDLRRALREGCLRGLRAFPLRTLRQILSENLPKESGGSRFGRSHREHLPRKQMRLRIP